MKKQQHGIVLFFALIVLILMTIIGVALASNSTQSLQMASSGAERLEAISKVNGSQERFLNQNQGSAVMTDLIAPLLMSDSVMNAKHIIKPVGCNQDEMGNCTSQILDTDCGRSATGSSAFKCRKIEVSTSAKYGRNNLGTVNICSAIEQQVLQTQTGG